MHKITVFFLLFFCGFVSLAQVKKEPQDTIKKGVENPN
jgi:hypothetical protein